MSPVQINQFDGTIVEWMDEVCFHSHHYLLEQIKLYASNQCTYIGVLHREGLEVRTLAYKLASLGWNPDPAINCHPDV